MQTNTEVLLTQNEQTSFTQISETPATNYNKITEALSAVACLTFFPLVYLVGNWFFN